MTIELPGCQTLPLTPDEQGAAEKLRPMVSICEMASNQPEGSLMIEFAKCAALPGNESAQYHTIYTDGAPFYVMQMRPVKDDGQGPDSPLVDIMVRFAFNGGTGRVGYVPPTLTRVFRTNDLTGEGARMLSKMALGY